MIFYCLLIFILGAIYLTNGDYHTYNKVMLKNLEELVIELGGGMDTNDHIELVEVEDCIHKSEAMMVYLWEGGLLLFMEGIEKYYEYNSM